MLERKTVKDTVHCTGLLCVSLQCTQRKLAPISRMHSYTTNPHILPPPPSASISRGPHTEHYTDNLIAPFKDTLLRLVLARKGGGSFLRCTLCTGQGFKRDVVYLSWPTAPSYMSPNAGVGWGGGVCGVSSNEYSTAVHRSPNKLWRSNSVFNLLYWYIPVTKTDVPKMRPRQYKEYLSCLSLW